MTYQLPNFKTIFEAMPSISALIKPSSPIFTIVAVTQSYCRASQRSSQQLIGTDIFLNFPTNPNYKNHDSPKRLGDSFDIVLSTKQPHQLIAQRYDVPNADGNFSERYWTATNQPILNQNGEVEFIIHTAEDVTEAIKIAQRTKQEGNLREVTETIPAIIWITNANGYCTYLNKQWYDFTGQSKEDAEGFGWLDATHPDFKEETGKIFLEANEKQQPFSALYKLRDKSGEYRWAMDKGSPKFSPEGVYEGMIGTVIDINDQKLAEEGRESSYLKLHNSEEKFRTMADNIPVLAWMADAEGWIYWYNKKWYDYTGTTEQEMEGWGWQAVHHPNMLQMVIEKWEYSIEKGRPFDMTFPLKGKDGQFRQFLTRVVPVTNDVGKTLHWFGTNTDVSEILETEKKIHQSEARFRALVKAADGFIWTNNAKGEMEGEQTGWAELTGQTYNEYQGYGWAKAVHPEDSQPSIDAWNDAVAQKKNFVFNHRVKTKSGEYKHFSIRATPLLNSENEITEWVGMHSDVTDEKNTEIALKASEQQFRTLIECAPISIALFKGEDLLIELPNKMFIDIVGRGENIIGKPLAEAMPELLSQHYLDILTTVYKTGVAHQSFAHPINILRNGELEKIFVDVVYTPLINEKKEVYAILNIAVDVTKQTKSQQLLKESEAKLRAVINASPVAIGLFIGRDLVIADTNKTFIDIVGKGDTISGKRLADAMPELLGQPFLQILDEVFTTGQMFQTWATQVNIVQQGVLRNNFYDFSYTPLFDNKGQVYAILDMAVDVTEQVNSRIEIERAAQEIRAIVEAAPFPIGVFHGKDMRIAMANQAIKDTWGKGNDVVGKTFKEILPEISEEILQQLHDVYSTGRAFHNRNQRIDLVVNDVLSPYYFNYSFTPLFDANGKVYGTMNTGADVTDLNVAKQKLEISEQNLRNTILQSPVAMGILKGPQFVIEIANNRIIEMWGLPREVLMNQPIFDNLPDARAQGFEDVLRNVFLTGETFTAIDTAVNLPRNGKIETVYLNFVYEAFRESNENITGVLVVASDVTQQVLARQKIEQIVTERTAELDTANKSLQRSNAELEQFAYIASHDLQEPLRKIRTFAQMLEQDNLNINDRSKTFINKINMASARMSALIKDVLDYSQLSSDNEKYEEVDLNYILQGIILDYELLIEQKGAKIQSAKLPLIQAINLQMSQLFRNLISNALKFTRPDVQPKITISVSKLSKKEIKGHAGFNPENTYYNIQFNDNGIGFGKEYATQIFKIFQRLHSKSQFEGTGIGLAMCHRIVQNHHGAIDATKSTDSGAVFNVILPEKQ
jgi:PAS domain S-box-containing protein